MYNNKRGLKPDDVVFKTKDVDEIRDEDGTLLDWVVETRAICSLTITARYSGRLPDSVNEWYKEKLRAEMMSAIYSPVWQALPVIIEYLKLNVQLQNITLAAGKVFPPDLQEAIDTLSALGQRENIPQPGKDDLAAAAWIGSKVDPKEADDDPSS